jgi:vitamin B12 transporter
VPWRVYDIGDGSDFTQNPRFERVKEVEGFSTQLSGQLKPAEHLDLRSWAYVTRQTEDRARYRDENLDSIRERNEGTTLISGGAVHGRYDLEAFGALRFAVNGRFERFDSQDLVADDFQRHDLGAWSLGLEYELQPVEQAGIVLGYGYAFLEADQGVSDNGSLFLAGACYDLPTGTRVRASAAHKLHFPSIRRLFDESDGGNLDLDSERCWCVEAAVEQSLPCHTKLVVTGFWLELRDYIEKFGDNPSFRNRPELRNLGVEVEATSRPWEPLFLRAAYSYLDARDVSSDPHQRLDNRPQHKLDAEVRYAFPWKWKTELRAALTWGADMIIYSSEDPPTTRELDDFVLLDLKLEQSLFENRLRGYVGVNNVLDQEWSINYGFPNPGRTVFGGLELRL